MTRDKGIPEYRSARDAFALRIDDDTLIWNNGAQQLHRLNAPATLVWEALATWTTAETVSSRVSRSAQLDALHVRRCLDELYQIGVVERRARRPDHAPSPSPSSP